jgi:hypothetical protein
LALNEVSSGQIVAMAVDSMPFSALSTWTSAKNLKPERATGTSGDKLGAFFPCCHRMRAPQVQIMRNKSDELILVAHDLLIDISITAAFRGNATISR